MSISLNHKWYRVRVQRNKITTYVGTYDTYKKAETAQRNYIAEKTRLGKTMWMYRMYVQGMSYYAIAKVMNTNSGSVYARLRTLRKNYPELF